jgi:hypothetical protein
VLGLNAVSQPMPWGGTLLAAPTILSPLTVPPSGFWVPLRFGPDPQLFGQLFVADAAATGGVAGLRATFGR